MKFVWKDRVARFISSLVEDFVIMGMIYIYNVNVESVCLLRLASF